MLQMGENVWKNLAKTPKEGDDQSLCQQPEQPISTDNDH